MQKSQPKNRMLIRSVRQAIDAPLTGPEAGGIRTALLGMIIIGTALTIVMMHKPQLEHEIAAADKVGVYFARNVDTARTWYQAQSNKYPLAMEQIAINAAQDQVSYNACAENQACAGKYDSGTDQNVPQNAVSLAFTPKNMFASYTTGLVKITSDGKPYFPQEFGGLFPVWKNNYSMTANAPMGFWWVLTGSPMGTQISLKDYFAFEKNALAPMHIRMFGYPDSVAFGAIEPMQTTGATTADTGWTGALLGPSSPNVQNRLITWGGKLSYPVTGTSPQLSEPSLYGLDPSLANDWTSPVMPQNADGQYDSGKEVLRSPMSNGVIQHAVKPAYGFFFPAIAGSIRVVPAGLALNQKSLVSTTTNSLPCPSGDIGTATETITTTKIEQLQTQPAGTTPNPNWVTVSDTSSSSSNAATACVASPGILGGGGVPPPSGGSNTSSGATSGNSGGASSSSSGTSSGGSSAPVQTGYFGASCEYGVCSILVTSSNGYQFAEPGQSQSELPALESSAQQALGAKGVLPSNITYSIDTDAGAEQVPNGEGILPDGQQTVFAGIYAETGVSPQTACGSISYENGGYTSYGGTESIATQCCLYFDQDCGVTGGNGSGNNTPGG